MNRSVKSWRNKKVIYVWIGLVVLRLIEYVGRRSVSFRWILVIFGRGRGGVLFVFEGDVWI